MTTLFRKAKHGVKSFSLTEYPDAELVKNIWRHPKIDDKQMMNLKDYCDTAVKNKNKDSCVVVEYHLKYKYGRYFCKNSMISSCPMWNALRSSLFEKTEMDYDIISAHQSIMYDLMKDDSCYRTKYIKYYIDNRDKVIEDIWICPDAINNYNKENNDNKTKRDFVKTLFTIYLYGGDLRTWTAKDKGFNLDDEEYKLTPFVEDFKKELKQNTKLMLDPDEEPRYEELVKWVKNNKLEKAKKKYPETPKDKRKIKENIIYWDEKKYHLKDGVVLSIILQDEERQIIERAIDFMRKKGMEVTSYNYDGFQVKKRGLGLRTDFIDELNDEINKENKWKNIKFLDKPFKDGVDVSEIPLDDEEFDYDNYKKNKYYAYSKYYFEKHHFKCLNPPCFIKLGIDGNVQTISTAEKLRCMYKHIKSYYFKPMLGLGMWNFIDNWLDDADMRHYSSINYYPPPKYVPANVFNLWFPYPILKTELDMSADTTLIHDHFKLMAGGDRDVVYDEDGEKSLEKDDVGKRPVYEYLLNWYSHVIFKSHRKSEVCILLKGVEGAGKSYIAENFLAEICGEEKVMITGRSDKAFGKFSNLQGKLLCVLNEANGKETHDLASILKDCITANKISLEKKGIDIVEVIDYCNFIFTTNGFNSIQMPPNDRRFIAIEVDDSKVGCWDTYFEPLVKAVNDKKIMRKFYEELKERKLDKFNPSRHRPYTELGAVLKDVNKDYMQAYIDYLSEETEYINKWTSATDMWAYFGKWWADEKRPEAHIPTRTKFVGAFSFHKSIKKRRSGGGNEYYLSV